MPTHARNTFIYYSIYNTHPFETHSKKTEHDPNHNFSPHANPYREIRRYQKSTELLIRKVRLFYF